jgi:hypothetical protein
MNGFKIAKLELRDPTQNGYISTELGFYNPLAATIVSLDNIVWAATILSLDNIVWAATILSLDNIIWADGSTEVPTDTFGEDWDCSFSDDDVSVS